VGAGADEVTVGKTSGENGTWSKDSSGLDAQEGDDVGVEKGGRLSSASVVGLACGLVVLLVFAVVVSLVLQRRSDERERCATLCGRARTGGGAALQTSNTLRPALICMANPIYDAAADAGDSKINTGVGNPGDTAGVAGTCGQGGVGAYSTMEDQRKTYADGDYEMPDTRATQHGSNEMAEHARQQEGAASHTTLQAVASYSAINDQHKTYSDGGYEMPVQQPLSLVAGTGSSTNDELWASEEVIL
jgi:hypothetical protein